MTEKETRGLELPDTIYSRNIENRVFQEIVIECLSKISGISLPNRGFFEKLFGYIASVETEQDPKNHSISVSMEVTIDYGVSIPEKAEEIQSQVAQELTRLTGLHVSQVHINFKQLSKPKPPAECSDRL